MSRDFQNERTGNSRQASVRERRKQPGFAHHKYVRVVGFRNETAVIEHQGGVGARDIGLYDGENIVDQVVVVDLGIDELRAVSPDRAELRSPDISY